VTPRQRLETVFRGGTPDRVPVTLYEFSGLDDHRPRDDAGYAELIAMQREFGETFVHVGVDLGLGLGDPNVVLEGGGDLTQPAQRTTTVATPAGDLTGVSRREAGCITWWQVKPLIESPDDCRKWLSLPDPPCDPDPAAVIDAQQKLGDDGVVLVGPGDAVGLVAGLFHFDQFVMTLLDDEVLILEMLSRTAARLERGLRALCPLIDGACIRFWGPEYAASPLLNPHRYFEKLVVDFDREAFRIVNDSGNFSVLHAHGHLADILDGIAELSPAVLEPLEVLPAATADVTMGELKRRIGSKVCLFGGIEASELELLSPERIDARIKEIIADGAPGGGFGLLPTSAPIEIPLSRRVVDNYRAYFRAAHAYGAY